MDLQRPQNWNRYSYALGNPEKYTDPTGEVVNISNLNDDERAKLVASLSALTGNTYGVDDQDQLAVIAYGDKNSATATAFLDDLIESRDVFSVHSRNDDGGVLFGQNPSGTKDVVLDFSDFSSLDYGKVNPLSYSVATTFLHEAAHAASGLKDPAAGSRFSSLGETETFINQMRSERGLPTRSPVYGARSAGLFGQRQGINFQNVDSKHPERVYYVYFPTKLTKP